MERKRWIFCFLTLVVVLSILVLLHVQCGDPVCLGIDRKIPVAVNGDLIALSSQCVDEPNPEPPKKHLLCILIHNRATSRVNRDTIREAWLNDYKSDPRVMARFVIGTRNLTQDVVVKLVEEQSEYGDILLLDQLVDSYYNLTRKLLYSVQWMDKHGSCEYLLKCDDDVMVHLGPILDELASRNSTKGLYWGFIENKAQVQSRGKYAESNWDLCPRFYLPYAYGGGYILSGELVHIIASHKGTVRLYANSDVSMGVWLAPYDIEHKHDVRFESYPPGTYSHNDQALIHVVKKLEDIWELATFQ